MMQVILNEDLDSTASMSVPIVDVKSLTMQGGRRQTKKKRKRVGRACIFCQRSHMSCDESRPCRRCIARGCSDQCRDPDGKRKRRGRKRKMASLEGEEFITSSSESEVQEQQFNSDFGNYNSFEQFNSYENNLDPQIQKKGFSNLTDSQFFNSNFNSEMFSDSDDYDIPHQMISSSSDPVDMENYFYNSHNRLYPADRGEYTPSASIAVPNRKCDGLTEPNFNLSITPSSLLPLNEISINGISQTDLLHKNLSGYLDLQEAHMASSPMIAGIGGSYGSIMSGYLTSSPHVDRVFDDHYFTM